VITKIQKVLILYWKMVLTTGMKNIKQASNNNTTETENLQVSITFLCLYISSTGYIMTTDIPNIRTCSLILEPKLFTVKKVWLKWNHLFVMIQPHQFPRCICKARCIIRNKCQLEAFCIRVWVRKVST
jgi:hypothetical protein